MSEPSSLAKNLQADSPVPWIVESRIHLDGRPVDFDAHRYQVRPLDEKSRRQCAMKGAQVGWTSITLLKSMHGLLHGYYPQGCLYLFPSREDTTDFSKGRFTPLIQDNPSIAASIADTDAANIKRVGRSMLYLRGARATKSIQGSKKTSSQLKSVPVDRIVFDEFDEMEPAMVDLALERVAHSSVKEEAYLSTPSIPDYGIDKLYQASDQRQWHVKCPSCGAKTCLEETFPDCLREDPAGKIYRACGACGAEVDPSVGEWVTKYPSRSQDLVGWHISQLCSKYVDPKTILEAYRNPPGGRLQEVYNSKLGRAYIEAQNRLSIQEVLALCGSEGIASSDPGPCAMGVDQGKDLHVVIGKRGTQKPGQLVHLGIYRDWIELDRLMKAFNVVRCVVDALPETRNAREFAGRFPGRVYLNYYQEHQKGRYSWNERELTVACNRTESLDASHNEVMNGQLALPKECEIVRNLATHLHNTAKKLEEDAETGAKRYVYVKLGTDHFRHAFNYECMARGLFAQSLFPEAATA